MTTTIPGISNLRLEYLPLHGNVRLYKEPREAEAVATLSTAEPARARELDLGTGAWLLLEQAGVSGWCKLKEILPSGVDLPPWFKTAHAEIGTRQDQEEQRVRVYIENTAKRWSGTDIRNWCGCFISWCMATCDPKPQENVSSARAADWEDWGERRAALLDDALPGDLLVAQYAPYDVPEKERRGHVAFLVARSGDWLLLLGGNQGSNPLDVEDDEDENDEKKKEKSVRYGWYPTEHDKAKLLAVCYESWR